MPFWHSWLRSTDDGTEISPARLPVLVQAETGIREVIQEVIR